MSAAGALATRGEGSRAASLIGLICGPAALVLTVLSFATEDLFGRAGFDLIQYQPYLGWILLALGPAFASLGFSAVAFRSAATRVGLGIVVAVALGATATIVSGMTRIGCDPITSPLQVLPDAVILAAAAAIATYVPFAIGRRLVLSGYPVLALPVAWAAAFVAVFVFIMFVVGALFPPLSCAPGPPLS